MTLNIEKATKSPLNIITGLSADTVVWLRAVVVQTGLCGKSSLQEYNDAESYHNTLSLI